MKKILVTLILALTCVNVFAANPDINQEVEGTNLWISQENVKINEGAIKDDVSIIEVDPSRLKASLKEEEFRVVDDRSNLEKELGAKKKKTWLYVLLGVVAAAGIGAAASN